MNTEIKKWFIEKLAQNPEYLQITFLPALDRQLMHEETAFNKAVRTESTERIKYHMGRLDGIREIYVLLGGLRQSEVKKPDESGLMTRIFTSVLDTPRAWVKGS